VLWVVVLSACGGGGDGDPDLGSVDEEPPQLVGIVAEHNSVRGAHGVGPLVWDPQLAAIAQQWAHRCVDNAYPPGLIDHNPDRSDDYPGSVGENIYGTSGSTVSGPGVVIYWAAEEADYDYDSNTCTENEVCGHYTQIVWENTTKVGCAVASCPGLTYSTVVVCNYSPAGNYSGQRPY
jgi:pathogenesis-related protein 1